MCLPLERRSWWRVSKKTFFGDLNDAWWWGVATDRWNREVCIGKLLLFSQINHIVQWNRSRVFKGGAINLLRGVRKQLRETPKKTLECYNHRVSRNSNLITGTCCTLFEQANSETPWTVCVAVRVFPSQMSWWFIQVLPSGNSRRMGGRNRMWFKCVIKEGTFLYRDQKGKKNNISLEVCFTRSFSAYVDRESVEPSDWKHPVSSTTCLCILNARARHTRAIWRDVLGL